ncbi:MAG: hypothetical protein JO263_00170, partial [Candidatus Eremiobacteraeota bacterium]|nr:hypothetical protein [Candidatus Eremiobacteraeota bacterium]
IAAAGALHPKNSRAPERAAMLLGYVDSRLSALHAGREYTERQEYHRTVDALKDRFAGKLSEVMTRGAAWSWERALAAAGEL